MESGCAVHVPRAFFRIKILALADRKEWLLLRGSCAFSQRRHTLIFVQSWELHLARQRLQLHRELIAFKRDPHFTCSILWRRGLVEFWWWYLLLIYFKSGALKLCRCPWSAADWLELDCVRLKLLDVLVLASAVRWGPEFQLPISRRRRSFLFGWRLGRRQRSSNGSGIVQILYFIEYVAPLLSLFLRHLWLFCNFIVNESPFQHHYSFGLNIALCQSLISMQACNMR